MGVGLRLDSTSYHCHNLLYSQKFHTLVLQVILLLIYCLLGFPSIAKSFKKSSGIFCFQTCQTQLMQAAKMAKFNVYEYINLVYRVCCNRSIKALCTFKIQSKVSLLQNDVKIYVQLFCPYHIMFQYPINKKVTISETKLDGWIMN